MAHEPNPLAVSLWLGAVLAVASLSLMAVPVLTPSIAADLNLNAHWLGLYSGLLWAAALVSSVFSGKLIGRCGAWTVVLSALALCAAGMLAASMAVWTPLLLLLAAILIGVANGLEAPAASQLLTQHVPTARRTLLFSIKQTGVQWGALTGSLVLPVLFGGFGWRWSLVTVALVSLVLIVMLRLRGLQGQEVTRGVQDRSRSSGRKGWIGWWLLLEKTPVLRRLSCASAAFGATQVCLNGFIVTFMVQERGLTLGQAGAVAAFAQTGGLIGRVFWGWLATAHVKPLTLLGVLGLVMSICALLLGALGATLPIWLLWPLSALFGLSASGWNGIFLAEVAAHSPAAEVAATTGAVMVLMTIGLILGPLAFAAIAGVSSFGIAFVCLAGVALLGTWLLPGTAFKQAIP